MQTISDLFHTLLAFLLQFVELFVGFFISVATLFLQFVRSVVGLVS